MFFKRLSGSGPGIMPSFRFPDIFFSLLILGFLILSFSNSVFKLNVYASDVSLKVSSSPDDIILEKSLDGELLFKSRNFMPGYREERSLELSNRAEESVYYRFVAPLLTDGNRSLFSALYLKARYDDGTIIYDGRLSSADFVGRRLEPDEEDRLCLELYLPYETGNEVMGMNVSFSFKIWFSDSLAGLETDDDSETGDGSGDQGEGSQDGSDDDNEGSGSQGPGGDNAPGSSGDGDDDDHDGESDGDDGEGSSGQGGGDGSGDPGQGSQSGSDNDDGHGSSGSGGSEDPGGSGETGGTGSSGSTGGSGGGLGGGGTIVLGSGYDFGGGTQIGSTDRLIISDAPDFSRTSGYNGGSWVLIDEDKSLWRYKLPSGEFIKSGFAFLYNPYSRGGGSFGWYHFDDEGNMCFSWIKTEGDKWYFGHDSSDGDLGTIKTGWHHDAIDNRTYYLSPATGLMQTGWVSIGSGDQQHMYYFATLENTYKQNWFLNTSLGRWIYDMLGDRTYGSMYRNERTPDGRYVNGDGILIEENS